MHRTERYVWDIHIQLSLSGFIAISTLVRYKFFVMCHAERGTPQLHLRVKRYSSALPCFVQQGRVVRYAP